MCVCGGGVIHYWKKSVHDDECQSTVTKMERKRSSLFIFKSVYQFMSEIFHVYLFIFLLWYSNVLMREMKAVRWNQFVV